MGESARYYIVEESALPDIFPKVVEAKRLMTSGKAKTVSDAVGAVGISRSAFYKYKDVVRPFYEMAVGKIITFHIMLQAALTISAETAGMNTPLEKFITIAEALDGISRIELLAGNRRRKHHD